jgi:hypothetical protein
MKCGWYNNRKVIDIAAKAVRKANKNKAAGSKK